MDRSLDGCLFVGGAQRTKGKRKSGVSQLAQGSSACAEMKSAHERRCFDIPLRLDRCRLVLGLRRIIIVVGLLLSITLLFGVIRFG